MSYQEARQTIIELMNEAEKKITEFSTAKAATSEEAEDKLCSHRVKDPRVHESIQTNHRKRENLIASDLSDLLSPLCR